MTDKLTGVQDRWNFMSLLKETINDANEEHSSVALLLFDVRKFRRVNRIYGCSVGDFLLQNLAQYLDQVARQQDHVARIGSDQFALILSGVMHVEHARMAAFKLLRLLDIPIELGAQHIKLDVNIGIALCPLHASDHEALLISADEALAQAKMADQVIGIAETHEEVCISENWDIEIELENAIKYSQLRVYFQPKISLVSGKPIGAEALVRWEHPSRGIIPPGLFIPIAESIGFIKPMTIWMLNSALRLSSEWTDKWGSLEVSVNIPPYFFSRPDFIDTIHSVQNLWDAPNSILCLEVLEQSFISDIDSCLKSLNELKEMGVKIAIDDFGTGYSSLSYFRDLPADELKIDQSFVRGFNEDESNAHIVELIIDIAHRFNLKVTAEGVEDAKTLVAMKRLNCDVVQGYFFSKPLPADNFNNWLINFKGVRFKQTQKSD